MEAEQTDGAGRFACGDVQLHVRCDWTDIGVDSITWTQSLSFDGGATWGANRITGSARA
jgi:hypothetical protein